MLKHENMKATYPETKQLNEYRKKLQIQKKTELYVSEACTVKAKRMETRPKTNAILNQQNYKTNGKINPSAEKYHNTLFWNLTSQSDRNIESIRPNTILKDSRQISYLLSDITVLIDINTSVITYHKLSKYKAIKIERGKMWNLKTTTIPVSYVS